MKLSKAMRLSKTPCLALVGAGGKTTALFQIARELAPPVLVTTTTHLSLDQIKLADFHIILDTPEDLSKLSVKIPDGVVLLTGREWEQDRMSGVSDQVLEHIHALTKSRSMPLLIEADGSRQLPLKAPAEHEPAIPSFVDCVAVVAGLSGLGNPLLPEFVHHPERFEILSGLATGDEITTGALANVMLHPLGGLKNIPLGAQRIALLNQADTPALQAQAQAVAARSSQAAGLLSAYNAVAIASLKTSGVSAVHEPVAGVILAGGSATRYGEPKQLLPWRGEPLIRHVARAALNAGLDPVVVVGGAYTSEISRVMGDMNMQIVHNADWEAGQSTSLQTGMRVLPENTGSVIFLLADQPLVTTHLINALVESHAESLCSIVAPLVDGERGNPVLFDQETFPELMDLSGDAGGRSLFSRYQALWVPWHDPNLLIDVDTPEDYHRLLQIDP